MTYWYTAYHLHIASDWALPALPPSQTHPDIRLRQAHAATFPQPVQRESGWHIKTDGDIFLHAPELGLFGALNGKTVIAYPQPEIDATTWANFLISMGLNILLFQRGLLLLHASVIVIHGEAVAFLGASGWGKSTLAAVFGQHGHHIIADDTLAVDLSLPSAPTALPAYPQIKLYPDSLLRMGIAPEPLPRVMPARRANGEEKRFRLMDNAFADAPMPLRRLYVLHKSDSTLLERLTPHEAFRELLTHSFVGKMETQFGVRLLSDTARAQTHLRQCTQLLTHIPMQRLHRPWSLNRLDEVVALIERDLDPLPTA